MGSKNDPNMHMKRSSHSMEGIQGGTDRKNPVILAGGIKEFAHVAGVTVTIHRSGAFVPKVCFADPKGSAISSQGICGYISVMASLKLTYFCD
jgi:hypothetical protein